MSSIIFRMIFPIGMLGMMALMAAAAQSSPKRSPTTRPTTRPVENPNEWCGFQRLNLKINGRNVMVVKPKHALDGNPWIWRTEFFGAFANADEALLARGFHLVYMNASDMYGAPVAMAHFEFLYQAMTGKYHLAPKCAMEGLSRGGLYAFNWAALHPDRVACVYGDAAVCDFKSWPGGKGKGKGSPECWKQLIQVYGFKDEAEALKYDRNPIDNLKPLADAKIPILCVAGDSDKVVPYEENAGIIKERYEKLGGSYTEIIKKGCDHHPHGLTDPAPIVEFILRTATLARP